MTTFNLYENMTMYSRPLVSSFVSFGEAEAFARKTYNIVDFEIDEDHDGCVDFLTTNGIVYSIERKGA